MSDLIERANAAIGGGALNSNLIGALRDEIERLSSRIGWATDRINYSDAKIDRLTAQLERINQWCLAYPRTVFIEPTDEQWRIANETLDAHRGDNCPSLTAISGSNMRHVVEGILALIDS